jgi:hypothetical protein
MPIRWTSKHRRLGRCEVPAQTSQKTDDEDCPATGIRRRPLARRCDRFRSARPPGSRRLGEAGLLTGGCQRNRACLEDKVVVHRSVRVGVTEVAFDPQRPGPLLILLPASRPDD